jgi:CcmD family protein
MDGNYVALGVTLAVWVGLFMFIFRLDKRVKKLEENKR